MPDNAREIFAENLMRVMERSGCAQADLTRELGLKQSTVSDWINAKKYPRVEKIQLLADYFGVLTSELTESRETASPPGTAQWLCHGLEARGALGRGEKLSPEQLEAILKNIDLLARAFLDSN